MIETTFTPVTAVLGGALIGVASVLLMIVRGNVFGATGILAGVLTPTSSSDRLWRLAVLAGMMTGPLVYMLATGQMPEIQIATSPASLIIGGFIVGIGVTYGSGCTSGHGVCGMARFSPRSIIATATFMLFTAITVYLIRHVFGG
ncbi:MAG: YeeE/YedE family protein [Maritimibacter sp.]